MIIFRTESISYRFLLLQGIGNVFTSEFEESHVLTSFLLLHLLVLFKYLSWISFWESVSYTGSYLSFLKHFHLFLGYFVLFHVKFLFFLFEIIIGSILILVYIFNFANYNYKTYNDYKIRA